MESCNSAPKVAVLHVKTTGPIETSNSGANLAVLPAQNDRWRLGPIEICYSCTKVVILYAKTSDQGWDP